MRLNKLIILAFLASSSALAQQSENSSCSLRILDTLFIKKGYNFIYRDSLNKWSSVFFSSKKEVKLFLKLKYKNQNTLYASHRRLNDYLREEGFHRKVSSRSVNKKDRTFKIIRKKLSVNFRLNKIKSKEGFLVWQLSLERYSLGITIDEAIPQKHGNCLLIITPLSRSILYQW